MESSVNRYIVVDSSTKTVVNYTLWDGNTDTWNPDGAFTCVGVSTTLSVSIGSTYNSEGVGVGTTSGNKWIIQEEDDIVLPIDYKIN